jgi:hypothetical protein
LNWNLPREEERKNRNSSRKWMKMISEARVREGSKPDLSQFA